MTTVRVTKLQAAQIQLDKAIRMLFAEEEPICTHTIAGAASILFADLVMKIKPEYSWDKMAQADNNLEAKEYFRILRKTQNFLKHAHEDHEGVLEFDTRETEQILLLAVMNASEVAPMARIAASSRLSVAKTSSRVIGFCFP